MTANEITRRQFLTGLAGSVVLPAFLHGSQVRAATGEGASRGFLSQRQRRIAAMLAELIIPRDQQPGAAELGAVDYIDQLLCAFETNPPRIFARDVSMERFLPLDRMQEMAWRLRIYGSGNVKHHGSGRRVRGLREIIASNLDRVAKLSPLPTQWVPRSIVKVLYRLTDRDFKTVFAELVVEGCFSQVQYGGNRGKSGWQISNFDGELNSYAWYRESSGKYEEDPEIPMASAGKDPVPLGFRSRLILDLIAVFTGGRIFHLDRPADSDFASALKEFEP